MIVEIGISLALYLLSHLPYVLVAFVAVSLFNSLRAAKGDVGRFRREVRRRLNSDMGLLWRCYRAATLVAAAAYGFVMGLWGVWGVAVIFYGSAWWVWSGLRSLGEDRIQAENSPRA